MSAGYTTGEGKVVTGNRQEKKRIVTGVNSFPVGFLALAAPSVRREQEIEGKETRLTTGHEQPGGTRIHGKASSSRSFL